MMSPNVPKPDAAHRLNAIGYSDQGGRPDAVQIMVNKGHAYVGHIFSDGFTVLDVRDPRNPKPVNHIPSSIPSIRTKATTTVSRSMKSPTLPTRPE
jgi:hypothetical protein